MQHLHLNVMYTQVVELEKLYLMARKHFHVHALVSGKLKINTLAIKNV